MLGDVRRIPAWLGVYAAFILVHLLLTLGTWDIIDQEELEFGTVPMLLLDGEADGIGANRTIQREGSQVLLAPFFVLIFRLFGTSMLALKLGGLLLTGIWGAAWFSVARRALPRVSPWLVAAAFVLPVPLVQRSAVSAASIHTHLGASALHALVLVLALMAVDRRWLLALSGALAGLGVFFSLTLGPLLPGVAWAAWRAGRWRGLALWVVAAVPGGMIQLRGLLRPGLGGDAGAVAKGTIAVDVSQLSFANLVNAAKFGPGFADPGWAADVFLRYSGWGALFTAICVAAAAFGTTRGTSEGQDARRSLLLSALVFTPLLLLGEGSIRGDLFDGPRYTLPVLPLLTIGALYGLQRWGWLVVAAHALGFVLLFRPAVFPAPWADVRGAEPWLDRRPQSNTFVLDEAPVERRARYALWSGMRLMPDHAPIRSAADVQAIHDRHGLEGLESAEFWRGVGYSLEVWTEGVDRGVGRELLDGAAAEHLWQGAAMAFKCAESHPLAARAGAEHLDALGWGRGRVDLFCRPFGGPPIDDQGLGPAFHQGLQANWAQDVANAQDIAVTPAFLRTVQIFARFDLREQVQQRRRGR